MSKQLAESGFVVSLLPEEQSDKTVFEGAVIEAVDVIFSLLGDKNRQAIYAHLESMYGIKKAQIPNHIGEFAGAIEETFGSVAKLLEVKIIERLHARFRDFSYAPVKKEIDFVEFISNLQQYLEG